MAQTTLNFRLREPGAAHPTHTVRADGSGTNLQMSCTCLASAHGALLCPHIAAVIREDEELVMYGRRFFAELRQRLIASKLADASNA